MITRLEGASGQSRGRKALEAAFRTALIAVDAEAAVRRTFDRDDAEPDAFSRGEREAVHVLALGKAAVPMARAAQARLGARVARGLVVTKHGHGDGFDAWPLLETSHPIPDETCAAAGGRVLEFAARVRADERLLVLLSGGASALLSKPVAGVSLADLVATNELLLACGAPIEDVNAVRKRLAEVSGGRLAAAAASARRIDVWTVSDVLGDAPSAIASGPCSPDEGGYELAVRILRGHGVWSALPPSVQVFLSEGASARLRDVPSPTDPLFERVHTRIVARNADAMAAAEGVLEGAGARVVRVTEALRGEAARAGKSLARLAAALVSPRPVALVAGGETTVQLGKEIGRGGRNQELALAAALELQAIGAQRGIALLAAGTDGTDGPTDAAGGLVDAGTVGRIRARGLQPEVALAKHDAMPTLEAADDLLRTGPTGSNVMDLTLVWVESPGT